MSALKLVISSWLFVMSFFLLEFSSPVYAQQDCSSKPLIQSVGAQRYSCQNAVSGENGCERDHANIPIDQDPDCTAISTDNSNLCSDDLYYTDSSGACIHKSGGNYDPSNASADSATGCVYNFQTENDKSKCQTSSTTQTQNQDSSSAGPSNVGYGDGGQMLSASNYKAPQHTNYTFLTLEHTAFCELIAESPVDKCIGLNKDKSLVLYDKVPGGGAMGSLAMVMSSMYANQPASATYYLANLGENLGIVKTAYAQVGVGGSGEGIIKPVITLWQVTRNLAYLIFIVVFIVVGFMIMLRRKINPQTVASVQQALPGLILGIILVTLSYFIAALLIDTAFVGVQVVAQAFTQSGAKIDIGGSPADLARDSNVFHLFAGTIRFPQNVGDVMGGIYRTLFSAGGGGAGGVGVAVVLPAIIGAIVGTILFPGVGTLLGVAAGGAAVGAVAPAIIGLLVPLILIIALLIQFFRLLWQLIISYISILVATIVGPLAIVFSTIPGRGGALSWWWKMILANSLVFPAVFAAFLFAGLILGLPTEDFNAQLPLFGGLSTELLRLILAYGIILGTPAIPPMVKGALGVKELGGIAQEATRAATFETAFGTTAAKGGFQTYWRGGAKEGGSSVGPLANAYNSARNALVTRVPFLRDRVARP